MRFPLDKYVITQGFSAGHPANDLAAPSGTDIKAPESGRVDGINNVAGNYFGGKYITIKGNSGRRYYMGHNSKNRVKLGQTVKEGQHIGDVGATGQATGPHIHFQVWNKSGRLVDPSKEIKTLPKNAVKVTKIPFVRAYNRPSSKGSRTARYVFGKVLTVRRSVKGDSVKGNTKWYEVGHRRYVPAAYTNKK